MLIAITEMPTGSGEDWFMGIRWKRVLLAAAILAGWAPTSPLAYHVYKWVDEDGVVHYTETPPPSGEEGTEVPISPPPEQSAPRKLPQVPDVPEILREASPETDHPAPHTLGPMPENVESRWLKTIGTGFSIEVHGTPTIQQSILLEARRGLPSGAHLETTFLRPPGGGSPLTVDRTRRGAESRMFVTTESFDHVVCGYYDIVVRVYRGSSKSSLLGVHRQRMLSRIDSRALRSEREIIDASARAAKTNQCVSKAASARKLRGMSQYVYSRIHQGMTTDDVVRIAGPPDSVRHAARARRPGHAETLGPGRADAVYIYESVGYNAALSSIYFFNGRVVAKERVLGKR